MKKEVHLLSYRMNVPVEIKLDKNIDWMANILKELCDDNYEDSPEEPSISFEGTLERKNVGKYGDYLVLDGEVEAHFPTLCTQTGKVMMDSVESPFSAVFLNEEIKEKFGLEEETTLFFDDKECELYFYKNDIANIEEVINEFIFLNKNPYPVYAE
jgi:hypothetical protein